MLKLAKPESQEPFSHEEVFIQHYDSLIVHALRLTHQDREAAEDLVQEAFVQFTFSRPDPYSIKNLEAYLYGMLRNLHLMDLRRATNRTSPLALIDYDSVDIGLRARDVSQALQTKNELALICSYACQRKRTSKAGSVLILRYFHGYYPNEIAQVIQSSRPVVSELLQVSRSEARRYVEDPRSLTFLGAGQSSVDVEFEPGLSYSYLLGQLRKAIFKSRVGLCVSPMEIEEIYCVRKPAPVDADILQHLVSCESCLDSVNEALNLPLLAERNPADMLSPEKRDKSGGSGSGGPDDPGDGGSHLEEVRQKFRRRARRVFEHVPRELCVSVNGDRQFSQTVASETCEQTISLEGSDAIDFIELSSEQGVRLLFMQVSETSNEQQSAQVDLSDGRTLSVSLDRTTARPRLHVRYDNPVFTPAESQLERQLQPSEVPVEETLVTKLLRALGMFSRPLRTPFGFTAMIVLLLLAGLFWFKSRPVAPGPVMLAESLLARSVETDQAFLSRTDTVLHREIKFTRKVLGSNSVTVQNVEIWHSAEKGITARRLYDEKNRLVSGLRQTSDGVQKLYHHGKNAELRLAPQPGSKLNLNGLWSEEPTAATFLRFVGSDARLQTEELASTYLISYQPGSPTNGVVRALVVLAKADLHVSEMTVVVDEAQLQGRTTSAPELVEYQFVESSFEKHSPSTVAPSVFEPDPVLKNEIGAAAKRGTTEEVSLAGSAVASVAEPSAIATREVEVEILRLLHEVKADQGEQVAVTRTRDGFLRVEGVVDTDARKAEILSALRPLTKTRAVWVEVETVAEAWERQRRLHPDGALTSVDQSQGISQVTMPAETDLRRYFQSQGDKADELTRQYAMRMITRSRKSMVHIYAMKRVLAQFSIEELTTLSAEAKTKWLGLVSAHASAYENELNLIRRELQPVFFAGQSIPQGGSVGSEDIKSAIVTANDLIAVATENDAAIRYSFTTSNELSVQNSSVKGLEFWRALDRAARLASRLANTR